MNQANHQTILVADDQNDNLVLVSLWLQNLGYRVVTAVDGAAAVDIARLARPDLILMDIAMPVMDGLDATRRLRRMTETRDLPIIFLTAFDTKEFRQQAGQAGGDGYLTKPINFERLSQLIFTLLPKETPQREAATEKEEQLPETSEQEQPSAAAISKTTGNLDPRFMLWRMFCAQNNVPIETLPSTMSKELQKKWQQLKKRPRPLFKF
jgi:CheY-like chemotaxis protein